MTKVYKALFCLESSQVDQYTFGDLVSREENHIHIPHHPTPTHPIPLQRLFSLFNYRSWRNIERTKFLPVYRKRRVEVARSCLLAACRSWSIYEIGVSASWTHALIAKSVRASEQNSVVMSSNPIQANIL